MDQISLSKCLDNAPPEFREALKWFKSQVGNEIPFPSPSPVSAMEYVVAQTKGIYKPKDFDLALTVRQTLGSPYSDREVIDRPDGTWVYAYHQEGPDPDERDDYFTNRGLIENLKAKVPVAVLVQTSIGPSRYLVRGLAVVTSWSAGFFYLEGFGEDGMAHVVPHRSQDDVINGDAQVVIGHEANNNLDPDHDARVRVQASVVRRQGQGAFRKALLRAYSSRCAVSGCDVEDVLDAAHITPYLGDHTDLVSNGILIRTDLHALFDRGLIAIDPRDRTVVVSDRLIGSDYASLHGAKVSEPLDAAERPSKGSLSAHIEWCAERL